MNDNFVNIKVDREERPDLDRQYMMFVQATTGGSGWPLSVFLTPDGLPFFGGTYFGTEELPGRPAFQTLLLLLAQRWKTEKGAMERSGRSVMAQLRQIADIVAPGSDRNGEVSRIKAVQRAFFHFQERFDALHGGFGQNGPKFPMPGCLAMLMRYWTLWCNLDREAQSPSVEELRKNLGQTKRDGATGDEAALRASWKSTVEGGMKMAGEAKDMVLHTLVHMARGGIYDHLAGGFHRYSVDRTWTLPHFEKMLYDQAQLISLYVEAHCLFDREPVFERVARDCIAYVKTRLLDVRTGGFFSAEDAESFDPATKTKQEGAFAVWTEEQVAGTLRAAGWSDDDVKLFKCHYTILPRGNTFTVSRDDALVNKNVLLERVSVDATAERFKRSRSDAERVLAAGRALLLQQRMDERPLPHRDEKIVAEWNGMMIGALATAYRVFGDAEYRAMAERAAVFVLTQLARPEGEEWNETASRDKTPVTSWTFGDTLQLREGQRLGLRRCWFGEGAVDTDAFAEDYAAVIAGLLDLHAATLDEKWIAGAEALHRTLDECFRDRAGLGFYATRPGPASSPVEELIRIKDGHDGVEPSANSLTALNCLRLHALTGRKLYGERFRQIVRLFTKRLDRDPQAMTTLLSAVIMDAANPVQLVLSGRHSELLQRINVAYTPHLIVKLDAAAAGRDGVFQGHVCRGTVCGAPTSDPSALLQQLNLL